MDIAAVVRAAFYMYMYMYMYTAGYGTCISLLKRGWRYVIHVRSVSDK